MAKCSPVSVAPRTTKYSCIVYCCMTKFLFKIECWDVIQFNHRMALHNYNWRQSWVFEDSHWHCCWFYSSKFWEEKCTFYYVILFSKCCFTLTFTFYKVIVQIRIFLSSNIIWAEIKRYYYITNQEFIIHNSCGWIK